MTKKNSKIETSILALFLLVSLSFVTIQPLGRASAATSTTVIKIGVVTDATTAESYYGAMQIDGLTMGLAYALGATDLTQAIQPTSYGFTVTGGGYVFQIYVVDGEAQPTVCATVAVQLITQDNVQILQGAPSSDCAIAVEAVAAQYQVLFMAGPAADYSITAQNFNVYTFRMSSNTYQDALTGGAYAVQNFGKSIAMIAPDDSWGHGEVDDWTAVITNAGGRVVTAQFPPDKTTDFTPYIGKLMTSNATVLIPCWSGTAALSLYTQLYGLGAWNQFKITTGVPDLGTYNFNLAPPKMPPYTGMMKYAFNLPNNTVNTWMIQNYVALFKAGKLPYENVLTFGLPDLFMPDSFAVGQAIVAALDMTGGNPAAPSMIQALEGMYLNTPKGPMYIRPQDHQALQNMYIVKLVKDNSTISKYYTGSSQFPSGSYWTGTTPPAFNVFKVGFWGVQLIETLNMTQTAPPIASGTANAPRPAVSYAATCSSSTAVVGKATLCKATVQASGSKAPTGTVTWSTAASASSGSGKFSKVSCKLSKGICSVKFTPTAVGSVIITTSYGGDSNYKAAGGGYDLLVTTATSKTTASCSPKSVSVAAGKTIKCKATVTGYSLPKTKPSGTVTWSQTGTGSVSFSSSTCTLVKGTCFVTMTGKTAGTVTLQAKYSGDPNNKGSSRTATLTINP